MEEQNKFYIEKDGKKYTATILTNFEVYGDNYCIYTTPIENTKENNVYCAKINGSILTKIEDPKEKELTDKIVKNLLGTLTN